MNTAMASRPLFRSEALKEFRQLVEHFAVVAGVPNPLIQVPLVIDASIVQEELRWRLHSRSDPKAKSSLQESIDSGTIVPFAPTALKEEIQEHILEIAAGTPIEKAEEEWRELESCLFFYEPRPGTVNAAGLARDADDVPYVLVCKQLGAVAIYSRDRDFESMEVPSITIRLGLMCREYARAASVQAGIELSTAITTFIALEVLSSVVKTGIQLFRRIPTEVKFCLGAVALIALLHPKMRATIIGAASAVLLKAKEVSPPIAETLTDIGKQFVASSQIAKERHEEIKASLPVVMKRSAVTHARAVCAASPAALSLTEIERRMKRAGYVSKSHVFARYLRRILRNDGGFVEVSKGFWALRTTERSAGI